MKRLLYLVNRYRILHWSVFRLALVLARIAAVPDVIARRAVELQGQSDIEYALGLLVWFMAFRLRLPVPAFNIHHLLEPGSRLAAVRALLEPRLDDYRVAKQYFLVESDSPDDEPFRQFIQKLLDRRLTERRTPVSQKAGSLDPDRAFACLRHTVEVLEHAGLRPFLISGTLLGFMREGNLLAHDNDLDIGVFGEEASTEQLVQCLKMDAAYTTVYSLHEMVQATHVNGTTVDIFLHYLDAQRIRHGTDIHRWYNTAFRLERRPFRGVTFFVPDNPERYLDENYGDWHRPTLFWDYSFDTPNQEFAPTKKTVFFLVERILGELGKAQPCRFQVERALRALTARFDLHIDLPIAPGEGAREPVAGHRTVITFGTFDILHIGLLNFLKRAAEAGDRLVVGVLADQHSMAIHGDRPAFPQADRVRALRAIRYVDTAFAAEGMAAWNQYIADNNAALLVMSAEWEGKLDALTGACDVLYLPAPGAPPDP